MGAPSRKKLVFSSKSPTQKEEIVLRMGVVVDLASLVLSVHHDELVLRGHVGRAGEGAVGRVGALLNAIDYFVTIYNQLKFYLQFQ